MRNTVLVVVAVLGLVAYALLSSGCSAKAWPPEWSFCSYEGGVALGITGPFGIGLDLDCTNPPAPPGEEKEKDDVLVEHTGPEEPAP